MPLTGWLKRQVSKTVTTDLIIKPKEDPMAVKMTGVWTRKPDMEFADMQAMQRAYNLISRHPYTIATMKGFSDEYAVIFGADELAILKASCPGSKFNMVMSTNEVWVQGNVANGTKVWVPPAPKVEEALKPGHVWVDRAGFGRVQVPAEQATAQLQHVVIAGFSPEFEEKFKQMIGAEVYEHVMMALKTWGSGS